MNKLNILFAGTPNFAKIILERLWQNLGEYNLNIVGVLTNPDKASGRGLNVNYSPIKTFALQNNIPILQPYKLRDEEVQKQIFELNVDILVVAAYGKIIPRALLNFKYPAINVHSSLLPRWRGAAPIERALLANDKVSGVSIMKMSEGLDEGDVYLSEATTIEINENALTLTNRLANIGADALLKVISDIRAETLKYPPIPQKLQLLQSSPKLSATAISYAHKLEPNEGLFTFTESAQNIHNKIRALSNSVGAYFFRGQSGHQEKILIRESIINPEISNINISQTNPGTILAISKSEVIVKCADNILSLKSLQRAGKKVLAAPEVIRGLRLNIGDLIY